MIHIIKNGKRKLIKLEDTEPGKCLNCGIDIPYEEWGNDFESYSRNQVTCITECKECDHVMEDTYELMEVKIEKIKEL